MTPFHYALMPSAFGMFGIVWQKEENGPKVHRVFLPNKQTSVESLIHTGFVGSNLMSCSNVLRLGERIQRFLGGEAVRFGVDMVTLETCSVFQRRVLLTEYKIPRG